MQSRRSETGCENRRFEQGRRRDTSCEQNENRMRSMVVLHVSLLFAWSSVLFSGLQVSILIDFLPKSAAMPLKSGSFLLQRMVKSPLSDELPHVRLFFSLVSPTFECLQTELEVIN